MQRTATLIAPADSPTPPRWGERLRRACEQFMLDDDERLLRAAGDPVDLERRLRSLERGRADRFAPLDPFA